MGLIRILVDSAKQVFTEQWIDYFKCDSIDNDLLMVKGERYVGRGYNTKTNDNIISDGSRVDVADGQFLLIVENGKVVDYCAEPGQYLYKTGTQPSLFNGIFSNIGKTFREIGKRFTAAGQELSAQRVYYINLKEITGNKWGVGNVPFRDSEFNFTMHISAFGEYSYKVTNPLLFYKNSVGNVNGDFARAEIDGQLKAELMTAIQPALGRVALKRVSYDQLPLHTSTICDELNVELSDKWGDKRGLGLYSLAIASVQPDEESAKKIAVFQESRVYGRDPRMMGARLGVAQADAMQSAAANENGAMLGFMGMNMVNGVGNAAVANMYAMGSAEGSPAGGWKCACGTVSNGNFCPTCGARRPTAGGYKCDKCGWEQTSATPVPRFCPNCGDPITDADKK